MEYIVELKNIYKSYQDNIVLNDLNLNVVKNEKISIIGSSGSGKSTLLRLLMTLEKPDSGYIKIENEYLYRVVKNGIEKTANEKHISHVRSKVGMVFQQFNLFPHMNVLRNVTEAPIKVLKLPKNKAKAKANELLEMVGVQDKIEFYPAQLSGGQQQRVAIARALAMQPKILLFDEVTSALDPELVGEVQKVLLDLALKYNYTMLIVTHEMNFAKEISDRVCFFDNGKILEEGAPNKIFFNPKEERTRNFLKAILNTN